MTDLLLSEKDNELNKLFSKKKCKLPVSSHQTPGYIPTWLQILLKIYLHIFIATLISIVKTWMMPRYLSTNKRNRYSKISEQQLLTMTIKMSYKCFNEV